MGLRTLLVRGLLAGLLAGVAAFAVAYVVGEPSVRTAISYEETGSVTAAGHDHAAAEAGDAHEHGDEAVVPRSLQSTLGLLTGTTVIGVAWGGLLAVAVGFGLGRLGPLRERATAGLVTVIGFVAVVLVPYLKYPPNPPAVGRAETIGTRTAGFFTLMLVSLIGVAVAISVARAVRGRLDGFGVGVAAVVSYGVVVGVAAAVLPSFDEVGDFPADTLWSFRIASLATQAALWGTLGLLLTWWVGRAEPARAPERQLQPA